MQKLENKQNIDNVIWELRRRNAAVEAELASLKAILAINRTEFPQMPNTANSKSSNLSFNEASTLQDIPRCLKSSTAGTGHFNAPFFPFTHDAMSYYMVT